jgi:GT2 family glycosyltransferase
VPPPVFSIVTPVYNPPAAVLEAMLRSVRNQSFGGWEHCLVDDASTAPHVRTILDRAARADHRIRVAYRQRNGGIVAASNDAVALATGDLVALLDHDDELCPHALRSVHQAMQVHPDADYLYTDEDRIDEAGRQLSVFRKPGWSPERLRTQMYTCHLSVLRRSLMDQVGGFHEEFAGSQDWDLVLRVTERARQVVHIPEVLYHWRAVAGSTADAPEAKPWAFAAGTRAIQAHCDRIGLPAVAEMNQALPGIYHLRPRLRSQPLVSIVVPTGGGIREVHGEHRVLVTHCVDSILRTSTYDSYELICVVDDRTDPATVDALRTQAPDRLRIVQGHGPFNFAERINLGALDARGEHLLLLNDDMEVVTPDWIERMVMYSAHPGIGAVGAKLLFGDGCLQHVGVVFESGHPGHIYRGFARDYPGYYGEALLANNFLAVTGACLMTPRDLFEAVGGLSPIFPLNYNDVDYCLKLSVQDYRVVFDPDAVLYHFESSSRSTDVERWELDLLRRRWAGIVRPDPYFNPHRLRPDDQERAAS